jgi:hypothetical protein
MVQIHFGRSGFRSFECLCFEISQRKITEVDDLLPRVLADGWSRFTSDVRASGVSNVGALKSLEWYDPRVMWQALGTSTLRLFGGFGSSKFRGFNSSEFRGFDTSEDSTLQKI